jgi:hypothetical protein
MEDDTNEKKKGREGKRGTAGGPRVLALVLALGGSATAPAQAAGALGLRLAELTLA